MEKKTIKPKPQLNHLFKIKNKWYNKIFLWYFKRILNTETYKLRFRGRHSDRKELFKKIGRTYLKYGGNRNDIPLPRKNAEVLAVYLDKKQRRW